MGQGTDSCGGWEDEYDVYHEELHSVDPRWTTRDGESIAVKDMTLKHLYGARGVVVRAARTANFACDEEKWEAWEEIFTREIARRESSMSSVHVARDQGKSHAGKRVQKMVVQRVSRGVKATMVCHCGKEYQAREADLSRGWGYSCSKSCAAKRREFGRPKAKRKVS